MLLIFYIPQFGKFPEYAWDTLCNFGVKSLEYAWDIQSSCKILYILLLVDIYAQRISLCFI